MKKKQLQIISTWKRLFWSCSVLLICACGQVKSDSPADSTTDASQGKVTEVASEDKSSQEKEGQSDGRASDNTSQTPAEPEEICELPEVMPSFPGGNAAMLDYIGKQTNDPDYRTKVNKMGSIRSDADVKMVMVKFVIDTHGKIRNAQVKRAVDSTYAQKALDIITGMPAWIPAQNKGEKVASAYVLPILFDLE